MTPAEACLDLLWCCLQKDDPWNVRILPKVQFGAHPLGLDEMGPDSPDVAVLHHFVGTWKKKGGWGLARELSPSRLMNRLLGYLFDLTDECAPTSLPILLQDM